MSVPATADDYSELTYAPRPRSRGMLISPNLRAALEYDEQTRASRTSREHSRSRPPSPTSTGLPPPPRPKSRASSLHKSKSPPMSPTSSLTGDVTAMPQSPLPLSPGSSGHESMSTTFNPYINPPPQLTHLYADAHSALAHSRSFSLPDNTPRRASVESTGLRTSESPQSEKPSPILVSSPESAEGSSHGSEGRLGFQRHFRYLSSLQRVEKMLVKGKTRAVGKQGDATVRDSSGGRRGSVGGSPENEHCDRSMREMWTGTKGRRRLREGRLRAGSETMASSAPTSPVTQPFAAISMVAGVESSGAVAENRPESRRSVGVLPDAAPGAGVMARRPLRPLISHGGRRASSAASVASSDESHEPPHTPDDPRISVSSTIYNDSTYSIRDPHIPEPWTPQDSVSSHTHTMDSDRESFIDLASPTFSPRLTDFSSNAATGPSYSNDHRNQSAYTHSRAKPTLPAISTITTKPPVPTSPKPQFNKRSKSAQPPRARSDGSIDSPSGQDIAYTRGLPPTTNLLNPVARAEGVRKTRKIAQLLGKTPGAPEATAITPVSFDANVPNGLLCAPGLASKRNLKHQRGAVSMSVAHGGPDAVPQPLWPPPEAEASRYVAFSSRRHSTPLTPDTFSFMDDDLVSPSDSRTSGDSRHSSAVIEIGSVQGTAHSDWSSHVGYGRGIGPTSPTSFMDLTEEDMLADGASSIISLETPKNDRRPSLFRSSSSIYSFTSDDLAEEDRRRKREKLAKLHRFLGSRVPAEVVLGQLSLDSHSEYLPPVVSATAIQRPLKPMENDARKAWIRRRRSSSAGELGGKWSDNLDRLKEELNNKEKALNVKRAVKMEKMFGVAPPQTLYHTRPAAPPTGGAGLSSTSPSFLSVPSSPVSPSSRNVNQTPYIRTSKYKKTHNRPGTADSSEPLISPHGNGRISGAQGFSDIYEHYRHSLNSLNDILDRDDKESLQRLHGIIHGDTDADAPLQHFSRDESPSPPSTPKAERRRSLPTRASITSLASEYSITAGVSTPPEESTFQTRRRRAAKLTQFFGVEHRDLVNEVFESLESGLEEESGKGTLKPDEVQELLHKLRNLKLKRNSLFD